MADLAALIHLDCELAAIISLDFGMGKLPDLGVALHTCIASKPVGGSLVDLPLYRQVEKVA
jgi:hypothetical protein